MKFLKRLFCRHDYEYGYLMLEKALSDKELYVDDGVVKSITPLSKVGYFMHCEKCGKSKIL